MSISMVVFKFKRRVLKIHKTTGARVPFMENYPELGILSGIFVSMENDTLDGNSNYFLKKKK